MVVWAAAVMVTDPASDGGEGSWGGGGSGGIAGRWWAAGTAVVAGGCGGGALWAGSGRPAGPELHLRLCGPGVETGPLRANAGTLSAATPAALYGTLHARYIPCLEPSRRVGLRSCTTPGEIVSIWRPLISAHEEPHATGWDMLVACTDEKEAAALLATAAKVVCCMVAESTH